jgi:hypothetical protein
LCHSSDAGVLLCPVNFHALLMPICWLGSHLQLGFTYRSGIKSLSILNQTKSAIFHYTANASVNQFRCRSRLRYLIQTRSRYFQMMYFTRAKNCRLKWVCTAQSRIGNTNAFCYISCNNLTVLKFCK